MALNTGVIAGWNYKYINTLTTVNLGGANVILGTININTPVATGVITVYNSLNGTGEVVAVITTGAGPQPNDLVYNMQLTIGCTIVTSVAAQDITVTFV